MNKPLESLTEFVHDAAESMMGDRFQKVELGTDIITEVAGRVHKVDAPQTPVAMGRLAADSQTEQVPHPIETAADIAPASVTDITEIQARVAEAIQRQAEGTVDETPQQVAKVVPLNRPTSVASPENQAQLADAYFQLEQIHGKAA